MNNYIKKQKGITLIALVITIIVLLILAGISISTLTGNNGLLTKTSDAKTQTIIGEEIEQITLSYNACISKGTGKVLSDDLQKELDILVEEDEAIVIENVDSSFNVLFKNTNNSYKLFNGLVEKETNFSNIICGKVIDNKLYLLLKNGEFLLAESQ